MPPSAETMSAILGPLYEAAASPELWPEFFTVLHKSTGMGKAFFLVADPENRCNVELILGGVDPARQRAYTEYFYWHDVLLERFMSAMRIHGEWVGSSQSVIYDDEYHRSVIYNELAKPQGEMYQCGVAIGDLDGGMEGGISFSRSSQDGPFDTEDIALLSMLTPHLKTALNMHRVLSRERSRQKAMRHGLELLDLALVNIDSKGRVLDMTTSARAILDKRDGLWLEGRRLKAAVAAEQARLTCLVEGSAATGSGRGASHSLRRSTKASPEIGSRILWTPQAGGALLVTRAMGKGPLQVVVTPFHSTEIFLDDRPAALVLLADPEQRPASRALLMRSLYGLSPAECRMVDLLIEGYDLRAVAEQMSTTIETSRFRLKVIFGRRGQHGKLS